MVVTTKRGGRRRETRRFSLLLKLGRRWRLQEREGRVFSVSLFILPWLFHLFGILTNFVELVLSLN
jgi:hypothetical protein